MLSRYSIGLFGTAVLLLLGPLKVIADCECGYSVNSTSSNDFAVFTEVLESDFTTLTNITEDTDWVPQKWEINAKQSKGPFGRNTDPANAMSNPLAKGETRKGEDGGDAGLELWVRKADEGDDMVGVSEVDSQRTDMLYGTFRAGFQITPVNGTCAAFFWYFNDTQEIDMEFLSAQMNETSSPVNLVLHSVLSLQKGGDAETTPTYKVIELPFAPDDRVHEFRFDWQPGTVSFYADGEWLVDMTDAQYVPSSPGKIVLSHWSNGNEKWSGGPPKEDAKLLVQYVKAYFNTTDDQREKDYKGRCKDPSVANAVCQIPDQKGPPEYGAVHFFHTDGDNKTPNQTIYATSKNSAAPSMTPLTWSTTLIMAIVVGTLTIWV
ncbi:glycoside hydrolase family 16 protein [Geopyxis carbonaria]|nr:glycoside hydrolase family 16 protein [Geopyxis carbonaria]